MSFSEFDRTMMQRCLELARTAAGCTAPNPLVGAVIVQDGQVVGEGFHPKAGEPHAEVFALRQAGTAAKGATLYVNLEPCSHFGRTPPCAAAIVAAGLARVVVGMVDPNPQVAGRGIATIEQAGIAVTVGVAAADCRRLNEAFIHRMKYQRPFGILKYAMTLDGQIAAPTGHSQWITSPAARQAVHHLRSTCDAVIIGGNTLRQDNPQLTSHGVAAHNPLRVVLSRSLDLPAQANLWQTDIAPTIVFTETDRNPALQAQLQQQGVEVIAVDSLEPDFVMQRLYDRGCLTVLWECGGTLAAAAIQAGAVQKLWAFIAPKLIGGSHFTPIGDLGLAKMSDAVTLRDLRIDTIGPDWRVEAYLESLTAAE